MFKLARSFSLIQGVNMYINCSWSQEVIMNFFPSWNYIFTTSHLDSGIHE